MVRALFTSFRCSIHTSVGNVNCVFLYRNEDELGQVKEIVARMMRRAIALDGTCESLAYICLDPRPTLIVSLGTGEHGVGLTKKDYLADELGEGTVQLMKTIKTAIDPLNIMNPGKVSDLTAAPMQILMPKSFIQIDVYGASALTVIAST